MRKNIGLFSCIIPVFNEENNLKDFLNELAATISKITNNYEIIVIDDGSSDKSFEICKSYADSLPIKAIKFSRNFGKEYAITAGIDITDGDVTLIMDSDFQHPFETIFSFIKEWENGWDVVYGVQEQGNHRSKIRAFFSDCFYKMLSLGGSCKIPPHAGDFRLLDKGVVKELRKLKERTRFFKGLFAWVGFKSKPIYFKANKRLVGKTKFTSIRLFELAVNGITAFSDLPLRFWALLGGLIAFFSLGYAMWIAFATIFFGRDIAGWPTLSVALFFLSGVQLISIGVLGEYISKIFHEVKQRPLYIVEESFCSDLIKK